MGSIKPCKSKPIRKKSWRSKMFLKIGVLSNFHRKILVLESLLNKVAGLKASGGCF